MSEFATVTLGGISFAAVTEAELVRHVRAALDSGTGGRIVTPNVDILRQAAGSAEVRADLAAATVRVADGAPLVWAARLAGTPLPGRVTGAGLIWSLSRGLARDGRSIYLHGGSPGRRFRAAPGAARAAARLSAACPGLVVAGHASPRFGFDTRPADLDALCHDIAAAAPDLVFVGLGFPKQERIIARLMPRLAATWFLGCGAAINFVAGDQHRAPLWMQRSGLEWAHRLVSEPRRLAGRYLRHDAPYALRLLASSALGTRTAPATPSTNAGHFQPARRSTNAGPRPSPRPRSGARR
jgi:N-acetylglucosaminyldiphosphoundecaprenol N-acetyl-beta-D-mannosaminyltransferase